MWMDTSTRWHSRTPFDLIFQRAEQQGVQCAVEGGSIAVRTVESMFRYFGELTCRFAPFPEVVTGCEVFHNDVFVSEVIMKPWVSCMYNRTCMCVENFKEVYPCGHWPPRRYNWCHRYEQSALGIIISKLYMEKRGLVSLQRPQWYNFRRRHTMNWFIS
ncbi:hypothetical protein BaRGS_00026002 [Batillaria attramentaria]|uniref:Uncharacterized protein n=1 Tax=Batillaria attramentaria TaxID=370345 RepID=A0ABD0K642_9CAEN